MYPGGQGIGRSPRGRLSQRYGWPYRAALRRRSPGMEGKDRTHFVDASDCGIKDYLGIYVAHGDASCVITIAHRTD